MAVNLKPPEQLHPVKGVRLGTAAAGIRQPGRKDLLLIELAPATEVAAVFTRNAFCAAPVALCRQRLAAGAEIRALLVNSGCANAGTGAAGLDDARATTAAAARALSVAPERVLPFSTGVIGQRLPVGRINAAIPSAVAALDENGWDDAARAIMTTDTVPKAASRRLQVGDRTVTVTGIAKGAGMICPDMATLLAFVACDIGLTPRTAQAVWRRAVASSFNRITVDGDTSTNDAAVLCCTGAAKGESLDENDAALPVVAAAIEAVCIQLAQAVVRDGEGATRFIAIAVAGARDEDEARRAAYAVAHSPLVKTACYAGDANWGRILAAVGRSGLPGLDIRAVNLWVDDVCLVARGEPHPDYTEARGAAVFAKPEYTIRIELGRGCAATTVWTCDLSHEYVRINGEYRT